MAVGDPVLAQQQQRTFRQRHVAVLAALAVPHVEHHPVTVNVLHVQVDAFLEAQTAGVDRAQADAVARETQATQDALDFVHAEHDGQAVFAVGAHQLERGPLPPERVMVDELDGAQRDRECAGIRLLVVFEVEKVLAQFFFADAVGRLAVVLRQLPHGAHVGLLGLLGQAA